MRADAVTPFDTHYDLATGILDLVMRHRRVPVDAPQCVLPRCPHCYGQFRDRVRRAIIRNEPIQFVLPAFPGKSPNPAKVLSSKPDMAERQSLSFLHALCDRIQEIYAPGARIVLCSDGRVFNDVVGIPDGDITSYQADIDTMIVDLQADTLSTFNLDHIFSGHNFEEMRAKLMSGYAEPLETVQASVRSEENVKRLYLGLTRFLFEDGLRPEMKISKTALQKQCRRRAYEVIQRSRAWDVLLANYFPHAVRLSIHPQVCGSRKIGIHLMETQDEWLTAWHSVAVEINGRYRLMKRAHVEKLGAELVYQNGYPSHYVLSALPESVQ